MKNRLFFITIFVFLWTAATGLTADTPSKIGPFALNQNIADFKDYVIMETALPIRHLENIEEVETRPIQGFKSGLIAYATCTAPWTAGRTVSRTFLVAGRGRRAVMGTCDGPGKPGAEDRIELDRFTVEFVP